MDAEFYLPFTAQSLGTSFSNKLL